MRRGRLFIVVFTWLLRKTFWRNYEFSIYIFKSASWYPTFQLLPNPPINHRNNQSFVAAQVFIAKLLSDPSTLALLSLWSRIHQVLAVPSANSELGIDKYIEVKYKGTWWCKDTYMLNWMLEYCVKMWHLFHQVFDILWKYYFGHITLW